MVWADKTRCKLRDREASLAYLETNKQGWWWLFVVVGHDAIRAMFSVP